jgi:hypothetical protein
MKQMEDMQFESDDFEWFTSSPEYLAWISSNKTTMLWHVGPPRTGKTMNMLNLIFQLENQSRLGVENIVAFVFLEGSNDLRLSRGADQVALTALRQICGQILGQDNDRILTVQRHYEASTTQQDTSKTHKSISSLLDYTDDNITSHQLWEFLKLILEAKPSHQTCICIDGLDKMEPHVRSSFLRELRNLWIKLGKIPWLVTRILVASRYEQDISQLLKDVPLIDQDTERRRKLP